MGSRPAATDLAIEQGELIHQASEVLAANQLGDITCPSPRLYPHQWSWDTAFCALGYVRYDPERAQRELRALFSGQWSNGLLPHINFSPQAGPYFPGPDFWQVDRAGQAPSNLTSGIVQPPVHASAVLAVYRHAGDGSGGFVAEMVPKLTAWHDYLHRERTRGSGLVEIWHPWESGMDNSPLWDEVLGRMALAPTEVPSYRRIDVTVAQAEERPTDDDYDRYAYLVGLFRDHRYEAEAIRALSPFAVRDALFNTVLVQADRDLAVLVEMLGGDPEPHRRRAEATRAAIETSLWDDEAGVYLDFDVRTGEAIRTVTAAGYTPLYAGVPTRERAGRLVEGLRAQAVSPGERGYVVPSISLRDPRFHPTHYWRGPVWPVINWLLYRGLLRYGYQDDARQIRAGLVGLVRRFGFFEHYHPLSGRGHGGDQFAWTAGLLVDLLFDDPTQTTDDQGGDP